MRLKSLSLGAACAVLMVGAPIAVASPAAAAPTPVIPAVAGAESHCWNANGAFSATDPFVFGGVRLTARQIAAAQTVADVASASHLTPRAVRIALAEAMRASQLNSGYRNGGAFGLFAQADSGTVRAGDAAGIGPDRADPAVAAGLFFDQLTVRVPGYETDIRTDAEIAATVSGPAVQAGVQRAANLATALAAYVIRDQTATASPTTGSATAGTTTAQRIADITDRLVKADNAAAAPSALVLQSASRAVHAVFDQLFIVNVNPAAAATVEPATAGPMSATDSGFDVAPVNWMQVRTFEAAAPGAADTSSSATSTTTGATPTTTTSGAGSSSSVASSSVAPSSSAAPSAAAPSPAAPSTAAPSSRPATPKSPATSPTKPDTVTSSVAPSTGTLTPTTGTATTTPTTGTATTTPTTGTATTTPTTGTTPTMAASTPTTGTATTPPTTVTTTTPTTATTTTTRTTTTPTTVTATTPTAVTATTPPTATTTTPATVTTTTPPTATTTTPTKAARPKVTPAKTTPPKTTQSKAAPAKTTSTKTTPAKAAPAEQSASAQDDPAVPDPKEPKPSFPDKQVTTPDPVDPHSVAVPRGTPAATQTGNTCLPVGGSPSLFDPGSIISDEVFYDTTAMTAAQITTLVNDLGAGCTSTWCLRNLQVTVPVFPQNRYCAAYQGGRQTAASAIAGISAACAINPQVMLVTLQKESGLLTRTDVSATNWNAAWGWHCPDTGPGGSANCDPAHAGFVNQLYGMAQQWSRYRLDPQKYTYQAGRVADIQWNVAETGCGSSPVYIRNVATASLYNYTPYQPNAASLTAYPSAGDRCSSYGNRNFFVMFGKYFGGTGASMPVAATVTGTVVTIPNGADVAPGAAGQQIVAPTAAVADGLAAGFAAVGMPYVWGGGTDGGGPDQGCTRAGGSENSCQGIVGFDCSGLTGFVMRQAGFVTGTDSSSQRAGGERVPWTQAQPGDIIGYPGHVSIFLGWIDGTPYMLQAPSVGKQVQVRTVYSGGIDPVVHRYWR